MALLNFPAQLPERLTWTFTRPSRIIRGLGNHKQHQERTGSVWGFDLAFPPLDGSTAAAVKLFLQRATSAANWFQAPDNSYERQSTRYGVPAVNGASQTGSSLALDGFPPSTVNAVKAGDRIGLTTGQVVTATANATANSSGQVTVSIDPPLRSSPADNSLAYIDQPLCVFKLPESRVGWNVEAPFIHGIALSGEEDFTSGVPAPDYPAYIAERTDSYAEGYIDIVRDGILHAGIAVTRASSKYVLNSAGVIAAVSNNLPATEYDANGAVLGLLVEGARTNLFLRSEEQDNAAYTKTDNTVAANNTTAPDGNATADKLTEGSAGTGAIQQVVTATADVVQTFSVFVKYNGVGPWVFLRIFNGANELRGWFNISTGAVGTASNFGTATGCTVKIKTYPSSWYRISISGNVGSGATSLTTQMSSASADGSITRVNGATRWTWGWQFESGAGFPSSYIPTTTATVTRASDAITTTSLSTLLGFSTTSGSMYWEGSFQYIEAAAVVSRRVWQIDDASNNNRFMVYIGTNDLDADVTTSTVNQAALDGPAPVEGTSLKTLLSWTANAIEYYASGAQQSTDSSATIPTVTTLNIGSGATAAHAFCHIKNMRYYARVQSAADGAAMTA